MYIYICIYIMCVYVSIYIYVEHRCPVLSFNCFHAVSFACSTFEVCTMGTSLRRDWPLHVWFNHRIISITYNYTSIYTYALVHLDCLYIYVNNYMPTIYIYTYIYINYECAYVYIYIYYYVCHMHMCAHSSVARNICGYSVVSPQTAYTVHNQ